MQIAELTRDVLENLVAEEIALLAHHVASALVLLVNTLDHARVQVCEFCSQRRPRLIKAALDTGVDQLHARVYPCAQRPTQESPGAAHTRRRARHAEVNSRQP